MRQFLRFIASRPDAWVQLSRATWQSSRELRLEFTVRTGRRGAVVGHWWVRVDGVKEFAIADADGGGVAFTRGRHPALLQHRDLIAALHLIRAPHDVAAAVGALWQTHAAVADDWIAPERYLGSPEQLSARLARPRGIVCRGPAFLVRRYEKALRQKGASASVSPVAARAEHPRTPLTLLHFGRSFVVAASFTAGRTQ